MLQEIIGDKLGKLGSFTERDIGEFGYAYWSLKDSVILVRVTRDGVIGVWDRVSVDDGESFFTLSDPEIASKVRVEVNKRLILVKVVGL